MQTRVRSRWAITALVMSALALLPSGCIDPKDLKGEGILCDSPEYEALRKRTYLVQVWGGEVPTKELTASIQNRTDSSSVDAKDLERLSDAKEYEITLAGQDAGQTIRYVRGTTECYTIPPCVKADGILRKEATVCAESGAKPFELYIRSAENYACEGFSLSTPNGDWKSKNSEACSAVSPAKSASGVFRFRIVGSVYQEFAGSAKLWFTDDQGRSFQSEAGLAP